MTQTEQIKKMKLDDLKPHPENPNMHPPRQIEALAGSIRKYGQYYPIIVDENYTILGGHGKAAALEHLGETEAEVRIISGLTEKQKLKLMLEDNKIQDMSIVSNQKVEELIKSIGDINILGYDENYISILLAEDNKDKINELAVTVKDNTGVILGSDENTRSEIKYSEEKGQEQDKINKDFQTSIGQTTYIECPNCGHKIPF